MNLQTALSAFQRGEYTEILKGTEYEVPANERLQTQPFVSYSFCMDKAKENAALVQLQAMAIKELREALQQYYRDYGQASVRISNLLHDAADLEKLV